MRENKLVVTQKICTDCGTNILSTSVRCNSCAAKHREAQPIFKEKRSARMRAQWANPEYKKRVSAQMKRARNTPEVRANLKRVHNTPKFKAKISAHVTAQWRDPKKRRNLLEGIAKDLRCKASIPELRIKAFLDANFADVMHQYVPDESMSPGIYDFYIPSLDLIVEVDDDIYWHTLDNVQKKDKEKEDFALKHEYGFTRITESQAKRSKYLLSLLKELQCM